VQNYDVQKKYPKKGKDSSVPHRGMLPLRELPEPDNLERFHHTQQSVNHLLVSPPDRFPVLSNR
jgi:hypothetical protein